MPTIITRQIQASHEANGIAESQQSVNEHFSLLADDPFPFVGGSVPPVIFAASVWKEKS